MWGEWFVRLKNESIEIMLTIKRMITNLFISLIHLLWIVISFQEKNWTKKIKQLAEDDRKNINDQMPNESIQGAALTVR